METHPDLLAAYEKVADGRPLNFRDQFVLALMANANFRHWENAYYQRRAGLFAEEEFLGEATTIRGLLAEQNHREYWACSRQTYSSGFREFVDGFSDIAPCPDDYAIGFLSNPYVIEDRASETDARQK